MTRPSFNAAWAAAQRIYSIADPAAKVAKVIGGLVATNVNNPDPRRRWRNTCAVRMSYILNHSGVTIPAIPKQTVSGADGRQHFYRVENLITFLRGIWGNPEVVKYPPSGGGALAGKKGLILFEISGWDNAKGHATLFNGSTCYDSCYFNEPLVNYRTDRANFWSLS